MAKKSAPAAEHPEDTENDGPGVPVEPFVTVDRPGIYEMPEASYHADPCPLASLSRTVLRQLVELSPAHAWCIHPKLGGRPLTEVEAEADGSENEVVDFGTAAHASFLQNRSIIRRLDFKDWRKNEAKEARSAAYAAGEIPLLVKSYDRAMRLIDVLEAFRARTGAFTGGRPEQTVCWLDGAVWCRARVDWLPDDPEAAPWDLKTTAGAATIGTWGRTAFTKGADLQDVFYARGLEFIRGEPPQAMRFAVVEQKPPYGIKVFEMDPVTRASAEDQVRLGLNLWENCTQSGVFPSYSEEPEMVFPPGWLLRAREDRAYHAPRALDLMREHREIALGVRMVETEDFGG